MYAGRVRRRRLSLAEVGSTCPPADLYDILQGRGKLGQRCCQSVFLLMSFGILIGGGKLVQPAGTASVLTEAQAGPTAAATIA